MVGGKTQQGPMKVPQDGDVRQHIEVMCLLVISLLLDPKTNFHSSGMVNNES